MRLTGLWAAAVLCLAAPVSAATYTVAPSGSDTNNGTSAPFQTLGKALSVLRDGDTVSLRAGTYAGGVSLSRANVSLEGYPGEQVTISAATDGSVTSTFTLAPGAIGARLRRLRILGGSYYSLKIDGDKRDKNTLIEDCVIGQSGRDCVKMTPGADGVTFRRCEIGQSGLRDSSNAEGIDNVCADRMTVQDCYVHDIATNGIYPKGGARFAVIERTRVENCGHGGIMLGYWTDTEWFDQTENPKMYECLDGMVRNCVILNTKGAGIGIYSALNSRVYNNTLVNVAQTMHSGIVFSLGNTTTPGANLQLMNNIVVMSQSSTRQMMEVRDGSYTGPIYASNNRYYKPGGCVFQDPSFKGGLAQWQGRTGSEAASSEGDPKLGSTYIPLDGSPCLGAAIALQDVPDDFTGALRLSDPDLGAYEVAATVSGPTAPQGLTASASAGRVDLTWRTGAATEYRIYRKTSSGGSFSLLGRGPGASTSYGDTAVTPGATYWYQLTAANGAGAESAPSVTVQATVPQVAGPGVPQGFTAAASSGRVDLSWTAGTVAGYRVYRKTSSGGAFSLLANVSGTATTYADLVVTPGATYWYQLTSLSSTGAESSPSPQAQATVPEAPQPPSTPDATVIYGDSLRSGWKASMTRVKASLGASTPVAEGSRSISLIVTGTDGFLMMKGSAVSLTGKKVLKFYLHGGKAGGQLMRVRAFINGVQKPSLNLLNYGGSTKAGAWVECVVPLADLGAKSGSLTGLKFGAGKAQSQVFIDHIRVE